MSTARRRAAPSLPEPRRLTVLALERNSDVALGTVIPRSAATKQSRAVPGRRGRLRALGMTLG